MAAGRPRRTGQPVRSFMSEMADSPFLFTTTGRANCSRPVSSTAKRCPCCRTGSFKWPITKNQSRRAVLTRIAGIPGKLVRFLGLLLSMGRPWKHPDSGFYWFRKRVPDDLRKLVGKSEERFTLGTRDPIEAKRLHALKLTEVEERWANLRAGQRPLFPD